jgi:hypothetical protein
MAMHEEIMHRKVKTSFSRFTGLADKASVPLPLAAQLIHQQNRRMHEAGIETYRQVFVWEFKGPLNEQVMRQAPARRFSTMISGDDCVQG